MHQFSSTCEQVQGQGKRQPRSQLHIWLRCPITFVAGALYALLASVISTFFALTGLSPPSCVQCWVVKDERKRVSSDASVASDRDDEDEYMRERARLREAFRQRAAQRYRQHHPHHLQQPQQHHAAPGHGARTVMFSTAAPAHLDSVAPKRSSSRSSSTDDHEDGSSLLSYHSHSDRHSTSTADTLVDEQANKRADAARHDGKSHLRQAWRSFTHSLTRSSSSKSSSSSSKRSGSKSASTSPRRSVSPPPSPTAVAPSQPFTASPLSSPSLEAMHEEAANSLAELPSPTITTTAASSTSASRRNSVLCPSARRRASTRSSAEAAAAQAEAQAQAHAAATAAAAAHVAARAVDAAHARQARVQHEAMLQQARARPARSPDVSGRSGLAIHDFAKP